MAGPYTVTAKLESNLNNVHFIIAKPIKDHICSKLYLEAITILLFLDFKIGTIEQCCDAIEHLKRIIKHKASTLNKKSTRRLPRLVLVFISSQKTLLHTTYLLVSVIFLLRKHYYNLNIFQQPFRL